MTQRELAGRVNIDFTYLSKIESRATPPPSEKVILQLAEALDADKDELIILAGKVPSDIAQILKDGKTLQRLRSAHTKQTARSSKTRGETVAVMKQLVNYKSYKGLYRIAIPIVLVIAVAASLWFAAPVRALEIEITDPQGATLTSGTIGSTYSFQVTVSIEDDELLPIKNIDLKIYNVDNSATYYDEYTDLALEDEAYANYTTSGTGADASIKADADPMWGYFTTGAGYVLWQNQGYTFAPIVGGYGYQTGTGTTSITYDIDWTPPSGWPTGGYKIEAEITAQDDQTFTKTSSEFTLSAEAEERAGPAPSIGPVIVPPGVTDVSDFITSEGVFTDDVTAESEDGNVFLTIGEGTIGLVNGQPINEISITEMTDPPDPPADASRIAPAYDLPDGLTFDPPAILTFPYNPALLPADFDVNNLVMAVWDPEAGEDGEWVDLPGPFTINEDNNTISGPVSSTSSFTVLAHTRPAVFTTTDLVIEPDELDIGEAIIISATITNTGDLSGSYEVTLKIDNVVVATKYVTLDGGADRKVTFTTSKDAAGTYAVNVDGLLDTFTIKAPPAPPPAPAPAPAPAPVPAPAPAPPAPTPPAAVNWWLIGGILAGFIILFVAIFLIVRRRRA